jgi:uncharacterized membrane protein
MLGGRRFLDDGTAMFIFLVGIVWGVVSLFLGLAGSFTLNSTGVSLVKDLVALGFGFFIVLPLAIAAFWKPKISAGLLVLSFVLVEIVGFSDEGLQGVYLVGKKLIPTLVLACGYAYVGFSRSKSLPRRVLPS